jgi:hypothetical protein
MFSKYYIMLYKFRGIKNKYAMVFKKKNIYEYLLFNYKK